VRRARHEHRPGRPRIPGPLPPGRRARAQRDRPLGRRACIERRLGIDIRNLDRIVPELQNLKVGDEIPMPGYTMRVERLDTEQAMVIRSSNHAWVWSFELRPTNGHTRLISRNRFDTSLLTTKDRLAYPIIEPGSWVMERKMLLTIKQRAERLAQTHTPA